MFCRACGSEIGDGEPFCGSCGSKTGSTQVSNAAQASHTRRPKTGMTTRPAYVIKALVGVFCLVGFGGWALVKYAGLFGPVSATNVNSRACAQAFLLAAKCGDEAKLTTMIAPSSFLGVNRSAEDGAKIILSDQQVCRATFLRMEEPLFLRKNISLAVMGDSSADGLKEFCLPVLRYKSDYKISPEHRDLGLNLAGRPIRTFSLELSELLRFASTMENDPRFLRSLLVGLAKEFAVEPMQGVTEEGVPARNARVRAFLEARDMMLYMNAGHADMDTVRALDQSMRNMAPIFSALQAEGEPSGDLMEEMLQSTRNLFSGAKSRASTERQIWLDEYLLWTLDSHLRKKGIDREFWSLLGRANHEESLIAAWNATTNYCRWRSWPSSLLWRQASLDQAWNPEMRASFLTEIELKQERKQTISVAEIKTIAMALQAYAADHGRYPTVNQGGLEADGLGMADTIDALKKFLVPDYIQRLPTADGWNHPYLYGATEDASSFMLMSLGSDGKMDQGSLPAGQVATSCYENDIIWEDRQFTRVPEGEQRICR